VGARPAAVGVDGTPANSLSVVVGESELCESDVGEGRYGLRASSTVA